MAKEVENYGAKVKKLRLEMGLTQNEVATALSVTPGYISNVENGRTAMSLRVNYGDSQEIKHFHMHLLPNFGLDKAKLKQEEVYDILKSKD